MDTNTFQLLNEAYQNGVYSSEALSEDELQDIQEWAESLIEEGYNLDEYTDEELYEAYLEEVRGAGRVDPHTGKYINRSAFPQDRPNRSPHGQSAGLNMTPVRRADARANALEKRGDIKSKKRANKIRKFVDGANTAAVDSIRAANDARADEKRKSMNEEVDLYDIVSEYLVSEGFCDSYEDADVIMANMSEEWRQSILDEGFKRMDRTKIEKQAKRLGGDKATVLRSLANITDTPEWRKRSTSQARKNRAGGSGSEYRKNKELQARDDARSDIEKHGLH